MISIAYQSQITSLVRPAETVEKVFLEGLIFHRNQILGGFSKSKSVSLIFLAGFPFNLVLRT